MVVLCNGQRKATTVGADTGDSFSFLGTQFSLVLYALQHGLGLETPPTTFLGVSPPRRSTGAANPLVQVRSLIHVYACMLTLDVTAVLKWSSKSAVLEAIRRSTSGI